ncbi:MAG: MFS transporter [Endomicrobiales bacterium]|nr:MFS transporter [Endomicrobiales bacterium]
MIKDKIRNSLKFSFLDGASYSVMFGFGDTYFNAYAIFLKATNFQMGLLTALPGLVSSLFQLRTPELTEKVGRLRTMLGGVFFQALMYLPILFIPFVIFRDKASWFIASVTMYTLANSLTVPPWTSIMSQYVPVRKRGEYFSWRQRICGTITILSSLGAGTVLFLYPKQSPWGFVLIFSVAMAARFLSLYFLSKTYEPRLEQKPVNYFSFWDFARRAYKSNFARFALYFGAISFCVNLPGPFFSVYMLRELKFDYLSYFLIISMPSVATLLSLQEWGRHLDRVGCIKVLKLTGFFIPLAPSLWVLSSGKPYLVLIQMFSGFVWAGFNIAATNFVLDAVTEGKRVRATAYFNLVNGLGIFFGGVTGGLIVSHLPRLFGSYFLTIFLLAGALRVLIGLVFLPNIKEVKEVKCVSNRDLFFSVLGIKPMMGVAQDSVRIE